MTSSGVAIRNPSLNQLVNAAYRKAGIIRNDEVPNGNMYDAAVEILNSIIGGWQAQNIRVWTLEEAILFLQPGQARYQIGLTSTDEMSDAFDYLQTTLASSAAAATTTVVLTAYSPLAASDRIGIELDDGTIQWTTVSSVASAPSITIGAALTGAASSGNRVFGYTSKIIRPLKVERAALIRFGTDPVENPIFCKSRNEYMDLPNKSSLGSPNIIHYGPKLPLGEMFVWPAPESVDYGIRFTYQRPIFDFVSASDTADLPQEWTLVLTAGLAYHLAVENQAPERRVARLESMYEGAALVVASWDREAESIVMSPDFEE